MQETSLPRDTAERPSAIVCIAYHQLSLMTGIKDPTEPSVPKESQAVRNGNGTCMVCTRRLFRLPIFVSITSTFCNAYTAVKTSHESVTSFLNVAEKSLNDGFEYISPVTTKVTGALETPLKGIDNVVCISLDFLERNVPSVKLPPGQIYMNFQDSLRSMIGSFSITQSNIETSAGQLNEEEKMKIDKKNKKPLAEVFSSQ